MQAFLWVNYEVHLMSISFSNLIDKYVLHFYKDNMLLAYCICHTFSIIMLSIILIVLMNYRLPYIPLKLLKDAEIGDAAIGKAQSTWNLFACFLSVNFLYLNLHLTKAYLSFKWVFPIVEDEFVHVLGEEADWVHIIIWTLCLKFELGNKIDFLYYVPSLSLKLSNHCYTWNWKNDKDLWEGTFCERTSSRC